MIPFEDASALNPVTAISRPRMMITIQAETAPSSTRQMKAEAISNLSAIGSKSCPMAVICFLLLARIPSSESVMAARTKMAKAVNSFPSNRERRTTTSKGISRILSRVRKIGRFIFRRYTTAFPGCQIEKQKEQKGDRPYLDVRSKT